MTIEIVTHFYSSDPDCHGDYHSQEIKINGATTRRLSDAYHDGDTTAKAFTDGFQSALTYLGMKEPVTFSESSIADIESE